VMAVGGGRCIAPAPLGLSPLSLVGVKRSFVGIDPSRVSVAAAAAPGFVYQSAIAHFAGHGACGPSPWTNRFSLFQVVEATTRTTPATRPATCPW